MQILRQSTPAIVRVGPFVDVGDGFTPQTDITLGGNEAELLKNASVEVDISGRTWTAIANCRGWFDLTLTTDDTDTVGLLTVVVQDDSDCLPVFRDFQVVEEAVYDAMYKGAAAGFAETGDAMTLVADQAVNVTKLDGSAIQQASGYIKVSEGTGTGQITLTSGKVTMVNAAEVWTTGTPVSYGTRIDSIATNATSILEDTNEIQGKLPTNYIMGSSDGADDDGTLNTIAADVVNIDGEAMRGTDSAATEAKQDIIDTVADAIKATTDKINDTLEDDGGTYRFTENALEQAPSGAAGAGSEEKTYTVLDGDANPIDGVEVWVTTDEEGTNVIAWGTTDASGEVVFHLDVGTYYFWSRKSGYNFTNPDLETVE